MFAVLAVKHAQSADSVFLFPGFNTLQTRSLPALAVGAGAAVGVMVLLWVMLLLIPTVWVWIALFGPMVLAIGFSGGVWYGGARVQFILPFMLFPFLLNVLLFFMIRPFWDFLTLMVRTSATLTLRFPGTMIVTVLMGIIQVAFYATWLTVVHYTLSAYPSGAARTVTFVWLTLTLFWVIQVLRNIAHTTSVGTFASWYYLQNTPNMPSMPTLGAFSRTMTTSFGPVSFGSLIVAAVDTLRVLASSSRNNCTACLLSIISSIIRYINTYVFVYVATYGDSFIQAAKRTLNLFERTGLLNLLTDSLFSRLSFAVCFSSGVVASTATYIANQAITGDSSQVGPIFGLAFAFGWFFAAHLLAPIESCIATIYVCFAEEPHILQQNLPEVHEQLMATFPGALLAHSANYA